MELILLRHGQSTWNLENKFTGWVDVPLSPKGESEARNSGELLKTAGFAFDAIYTSVLKRALQTVDLALEILSQASAPIHQHWELNERHYGALQGLDKKETVQKYGADQVQKWRRGYDIKPPPATPDPGAYEFKYPQIPESESLKDTYARVIPFYESQIIPGLKNKKRLLICAHGNSLRALVKYLDHMSDDEIVNLNIPTGIPLIYDLDPDTLEARSHRYLGDADAARAAAQSVADQTSQKK